MIFINLHANAECEEPGCDAKHPVRMFLRPDGGFGFQLVSKLWQVGMQGPAAPWHCFCPKHTKTVQPVQAPALNGSRT